MVGPQAAVGQGGGGSRMAMNSVWVASMHDHVQLAIGGTCVRQDAAAMFSRGISATKGVVGQPRHRRLVRLLV